MTLSDDSTLVLNALRKESESDSREGWRMVYLDNARPSSMTPTQFRAQLSVLSKAGLYKVVDGYAFGEVKMSD